MTTPIDPDDINTLSAIARKVTRFDGFIPATVATAIARAVCPPGHHVIADDDLRALLALAAPIVTPLTEDDARVDRLRALIGDE